MNPQRLALFALSALLVVTGIFAWRLQLGPPLTPETNALATLPTRLGAWQSRDVPLESTVEAELRADFNLQRAYVHPSGEVIWLYIGYYGTRRGGRPEHTPRGCYTGAGFAIHESRVLTADPEARLRVAEYLVERDERQRLVHFWYRSFRRTGMVSGFEQNLDRFAGRLLEGRADGALIRVSTPVPDGDVAPARSRLLAFAVRLDPLIGERWPSETQP